MATVEAVRRVRVAERDALCAKVVDVLRADERLVGAWVFGSLGNRAADAWSDVDLCVVARDEALEEVLADRYTMVARGIGSPLIEQDVPHNAPPGGAFRLVHYRAEVAMQEIDWVWRGYAGARPPAGARVLFGERELVVAPDATGEGKNPDERDPIQARALFFWAMCPIVAKYVARGAGESAAKMLVMTADATRFVHERLELGPLLAPGESPDELRQRLERASGTEMLEMLRAQCRAMEEPSKRLRLYAMSAAGRLDPQAPGQVYGLFDLVESTLR